jgi:hypothetical protein
MMKINHYSIFTELASDNIDWNHLRDSNVEAPYFIPFEKKDYLALIENLDFSFYIDSIKKYCKDNNIRRIISIGAGRCGLEYHLKNNTNLEVIVTDTTDSILRIKEFNVFNDAYQLNLLENTDKFNIDSNTLILLSRIDTEFNDDNFKLLFDVLQSKNVKYICLIPAELLSFKIIIAEFKIFLISILKNKKRVFCGFARSKSEFRKAWMKHYKERSSTSSNKIFQLIQK